MYNTAVVSSPVVYCCTLHQKHEHAELQCGDPFKFDRLLPEDGPHQLALRPWLPTDDRHIVSIDNILLYATSDDFA